MFISPILSASVSVSSAESATEKSVELTFQPPVIEAALFIGAPAEGFFEAGIRGNGAEAPGRVTLLEKSKIMIEGTAGFNITETLTVGRITEENAVRFLQIHLLQGEHGERDPAFQSGLAKMAASKING